MNTYEVSASFKARHGDRERTGWNGRVQAANREHAMLMAGIQIAHAHGGLVAASLRVTVTRVRMP